MKCYTWTTPNGYKVPIMLEEIGADYEIVPVNLDRKEQLSEEFIALNPNHKIPVLVDDDIVIFESGAILLYLAQRSGMFEPKDLQQKYQVVEWLMFQMANIGPMFGQANHFVKHASEKIAYAIKRYVDETNRLAAILETRLSTVPYLAGEYGIADIATWPWVRSAIRNGHIDIDRYPTLKDWYERIGSREAVKRALEKVDAACE